MGKRAIAKLGGGDSGLMLFVGHLTAHVAVGAGVGGVWGLVIHLFCAGRVVASMIGIQGGCHCGKIGCGVMGDDGCLARLWRLVHGPGKMRTEMMTGVRGGMKR